MCLMGCPNPYELQQSWECTILKVLSFTKIIWSSKKIFTYRIQNYQLSSMANSSFMGHIGHVALASNSETGKRNFFLRSFCLSMIKDFQKSALPTLLLFERVSAAHQPLVCGLLAYRWPLVAPTWRRTWSQASGRTCDPGCRPRRYPPWRYGTLASTCHLASVTTWYNPPIGPHVSRSFWSVSCPLILRSEVRRR